MRRTIRQLITAAFAGETITPDEARRVLHHMQRMNRVDDLLLRESSLDPSSLTDPALYEAGGAFASFRKAILRDLRRASAVELRKLVRYLLVVIGTFDELFAATEGRGRRSRRQSQHGQKGAATARRRKALAIRRTVEALDGSGRRITTKGVRRYLRENDPDWGAATAEERDRKVAALQRRLRRTLPKKSGHSPG